MGQLNQLSITDTITDSITRVKYSLVKLSNENASESSPERGIELKPTKERIQWSTNSKVDV